MPDPDRTSDPETARVDALLERAERGSVTAAETEELALYVQRDPSLAVRIEEAARRGELGRGWLDRVHRDEALARLDRSTWARTERALGLAALALGTISTLVSPAAGAALLTGGVVILTYSFVRARVRAHAQDPYKDVEQ